MSVSVSVLVRQRHVLQAVVLRAHLRVLWVGQAIGRVRRQPVGRRVSREARAGTEALAGADGAGPFGKVLGVQAISL